MPAETNTYPQQIAFESFLLHEKGLSQASLCAYRSDLLHYYSFAVIADKKRKHHESKAPSLEQLTTDCLRLYLDSLQNLGFAASSLSRRLSSLRSYSRFLLDEKVLAKDPTAILRSAKLSHYHPEYLSHIEVEQLYHLLYENIQAGKKAAWRDLCLIELMYGGGLRVSEAINLSVNQILWDDELISVIGKGDKQRLIPLGKKVKASIGTYLKVERCAKEAANELLILNQQGTNLSRMGAWKRVQDLVISAGIETRCSPHTFRHTFASHLIEAGADLRAVQEMLGHADISSTQIYTHVEAHYLAEVHRSFHPRNHIG